MCVNPERLAPRRAQLRARCSLLSSTPDLAGRAIGPGTLGRSARRRKTIVSYFYTIVSDIFTPIPLASTILNVYQCVAYMALPLLMDISSKRQPMLISECGSIPSPCYRPEPSQRPCDREHRPPPAKTNRQRLTSGLRLEPHRAEWNARQSTGTFAEIYRSPTPRTRPLPPTAIGRTPKKRSTSARPLGLTHTPDTPYSGCQAIAQ